MDQKRAYKPSKLEPWMRKHHWNYGVPPEGLRSRLYALLTDHRPWWDWGHRLVIAVGSNDCGNWGEPEPPTWYYRKLQPKRMTRTGYPTYPRSCYQVIKNYDEFSALTHGLNEDQMYEWNAICVNCDGDLHLGHQYWGGRFFGMDSRDQALLRRYLNRWRLQNWFGLRTWLWKQGLHASVYKKKPRACGVTPSRCTGGYDHWRCEADRRHIGDHVYGNYRWSGRGHVVYVGDGVNA